MVNEEAILLDGLEGALIGMALRFGMETVALYDYNKILEILCERDGMTLDEAQEYAEFNILGLWAGDGTPVFAKLSSD